jgi:hypothetical protein
MRPMMASRSFLLLLLASPERAVFPALCTFRRSVTEYHNDAEENWSDSP